MGPGVDERPPPTYFYFPSSFVSVFTQSVTLDFKVAETQLQTKHLF